MEMMDRAYIVEPTAVNFELFHGASNSERAAWRYARGRIRYGMHDITDFINTAGEKSSKGVGMASAAVKIK